MANYWKTENLWKIHGKSMETLWESIGSVAGFIHQNYGKLDNYKRTLPVYQLSSSFEWRVQNGPGGQAEPIIP